jgi:hypothetical protein
VIWVQRGDWMESRRLSAHGLLLPVATCCSRSAALHEIVNATLRWLSLHATTIRLRNTSSLKQRRKER